MDSHVKPKTNKVFDVIVCGLGGAGSSTLYHLAKAGYDVLGIEKFDICHKNGSSHGESRIIRKSYFEGNDYVPLLVESYKLWNDLENETGTKIFNRVGCINIGKPDQSFLINTIDAAKKNNFAHKIYTGSESNEIFKNFTVPKDFNVFHEEDAGALNADMCIRAFHQVISNHKNASVITGNAVKKVVKLNNSNNEVNYEVITDNNTKYLTKKVVLSLGAYINDVLEESFNKTIPVKVEMNIVTFCKHKDNREFKGPVYIGNYNDESIFYGFPDFGNGFKFAPYHCGFYYNRVKDVKRDIPKQFNSNLFAIFSKVFTDFSEATIDIKKQETCLYTVTPDSHFIIDYYNNDDNLVLVSACSGHGFKFVSGLGNYVKDLLEKRRFIKYFSLSRFEGKTKF